MFIYLSVCLCGSASVGVCLSVSVCLRLSVSVCLSASACLCLSVCLSVCPSICASVCESTYTYVYIYTHMFMHRRMRLHVHVLVHRPTSYRYPGFNHKDAKLHPHHQGWDQQRHPHRLCVGSPPPRHGRHMQPGMTKAGATGVC